jgi:hypothetical protein
LQAALDGVIEREIDGLRRGLALGHAALKVGSRWRGGQGGRRYDGRLRGRDAAKKANAQGESRGTKTGWVFTGVF